MFWEAQLPLFCRLAWPPDRSSFRRLFLLFPASCVSSILSLDRISQDHEEFETWWMSCHSHRLGGRKLKFLSVDCPCGVTTWEWSSSLSCLLGHRLYGDRHSKRCLNHDPHELLFSLDSLAPCRLSDHSAELSGEASHTYDTSTSCRNLWSNDLYRGNQSKDQPTVPSYGVLQGSSC